MLSERERREIEAVLQGSAQKEQASIGVLKVIQRHRGWVSDESIRDIAGILEMAADEIDSVATFYSLIFRKPVGKHVILICDSVSCWIMGYDNLLKHLNERLGISVGETSADGRFTLLPNACLGVCDHAPAMMVDNDLYTDLNTQKIDEILERYR